MYLMRQYRSSPNFVSMKIVLEFTLTKYIKISTFVLHDRTITPPEES